MKNNATKINISIILYLCMIATNTLAAFGFYQWDEPKRSIRKISYADHSGGLYLQHLGRDLSTVVHRIADRKDEAQ